MSAGKIVEFHSLDVDIQELLKTGVHARTNSYSPYSNFKVGCALRCENGTIFKGCNIENAAYSPSICAERAAIGSAVSNGNRKFIDIAVIADFTDNFVSPCGVCRQTIIEFGDIPIYLSRPSLETVLITSAKEILPLAFTGIELNNK